MPSFWDVQQNLRGKPQSPPAGQKPLTVTQLTARIEKAIKAGLPGSLFVQGEVSNFKINSGSGHAYFTLRDAVNCIDCIMFRSEAVSLKFKPTDGLELVATGRVAVFGQRGKYQLQVSHLQPVGQGALELARQQIQARLQAEGLFDRENKKPLPRFPTRLVLITSTQTAALQDMLKVLRRFPFLRVCVYHVPVQGDGSAQRIAAALTHVNRAMEDADVILLGRGGGSLEDLWEFNEEILARAIGASNIPVVTGIGHEIDVSIADLAADYHAHTPTEAAQVVTAHWRTARDTLRSAQSRLARETASLFQHARQRLAHAARHEFFRRPLDRINHLRQLVDDRQRTLLQAVTDRLRLARQSISKFEARLNERHPRHLTALQAQRLAALEDRLRRATDQSVKAQARRIDLLSTRLHCVNPQEILKRGYTLTTSKKTGQIIKNPTDVKPGDTLITRLAEGEIQSRVEDARQLKLFE
jgi:exodeoxyribonuclease VII large subunit